LGISPVLLPHIFELSHGSEFPLKLPIIKSGRAFYGSV
jgi:hypothetical protein